MVEWGLRLLYGQRGSLRESPCREKETVRTGGVSRGDTEDEGDVLVRSGKGG